MYKLLIVDDDDMIREGIKNAIPWHQYSITEVETAENGGKGWPLFKAFLPDIVITDIRMPEKDGLVLLKEIREIKENTKVIILSGYDDFSYAQDAIKSGAFDYLLKTADMEELMSAIKKALAEIDSERRNQELNRKLKKQLKMSLPLLRNRYLNELIFGFTDLKKLAKRMEYVDLKLGDGLFIVFVAEVDDLDLLNNKETEEERFILKLKIIAILEEVFGRSAKIFENKYEEFVGIHSCESSLSIDENRKKLAGGCEDAIGRIAKNTGLNVSIGLSNPGRGLISIKSSYEDAKKALEHKLFTGKSSIVNISDISGYLQEDNYSLDSDTENKLISALRTGEKKTVLAIVEDIFKQIRQKRSLGLGHFHRVCIELMSTASRVLIEFDSGIDEVFGREFLYFDEVKKYKNIEDAKEWMLKNFECLACYILKSKILKARKIVEVAKEYIDNHYNENISLNMIAELVYMSPNYFSNLFSSTVKKSFLEYVTDRRIEKAKQLLGQKDTRAFEVGEMVGYTNPHYFSRIFKKYTGLSPTEYRESLMSQTDIS